MTIDKMTAEMIRDEIKEVTAEIFKRHGLEAPRVSAKYGSVFSVSLEAAKFVRGEGGINLQSKEAQYYTLYGFTTLSGEALVAPLGTKFVNGGKEYIFAGIAASRRKYPIYCLREGSLEPTLFTEGLVKRINQAAGVLPA